MLKDIGYALRTLRQSPGFALTAIVSIALAIGANSTIYSFANGLLLRPLPVPNPSQVVTLRSVPLSVNSLALRGYSESRMSYPDFQDFRSNSRSFDGLVAYEEVPASFARSESANAQFKLGYQVSGDFFRVLQAEPQIGRGFRREEDEKQGEDPVLVVSRDLWRNEFAEDPSVIGRRVLLNNVEFTIIGVARESFTSLDHFLQPEFFIPVAAGSKLYASRTDQRTNRNLHRFLIKGCLKPGVSIRAAAQEASAFAKSLESLYPATNRGFNLADLGAGRRRDINLGVRDSLDSLRQCGQSDVGPGPRSRAGDCRPPRGGRKPRQTGPAPTHREPADRSRQRSAGRCGRAVHRWTCIKG